MKLYFLSEKHSCLLPSIAYQEMSDRLIKLVLRNYLSSPDEKSGATALQLLQTDSQALDLSGSFELLSQLNTRVLTLIQSRNQYERSLGLQIAILWTNERVSSLDCLRQFGKQWIEKALAIVNRANDEKTTMKLALELTTVIFSSATRLPEFSRNVTQPLAVKYAQKLLDILKQRLDLQIDAINAISDHLTTHSSSFRPQLNALNAQVVSLLAKSPDNTNKKHADAVARLYSTSARAAGKANVSQTLKKLIETTLKSIEKDIGVVMGDLFGSSIKNDDLKLDQTRAPSGDLLLDAPFLVRRVGVLFYSICKALSGSNDTYIAIPVGSIVALCTRILHLTPATIVSSFSFTNICKG